MAGQGAFGLTWLRGRPYAPPVWLGAAALGAGLGSIAFHYNQYKYLHTKSWRYPFFKHDFPRKDYKGHGTQHTDSADGHATCELI
jgi:hypothetical protein